MAYYIINGKKSPYPYDINKDIARLEKIQNALDIKKNEITWDDYLELSKTLKEIENLPKIVKESIIDLSKDNIKVSSQMKKVLNSAVDNTKEKREYTKHVLIERTLTVSGYEFNFIDIETKEFYWSYYSDELDYNMAKESFLNKISGKVKFYLDEDI